MRQLNVENKQENRCRCSFVEAPRSIDEMKKIGKEINAPLVANMIEGGATPLSSAETLSKMGFNIILYPLSVFICKYICNNEYSNRTKKYR
jgi:PEP phosphonomutase and related enzymes